MGEITWLKGLIRFVEFILIVWGSTTVFHANIAVTMMLTCIWFKVEDIRDKLNE